LFAVLVVSAAKSACLAAERALEVLRDALEARDGT
jgi:hypothetical protein